MCGLHGVDGTAEPGGAADTGGVDGTAEPGGAADTGRVDGTAEPGGAANTGGVDGTAEPGGAADTGRGYGTSEPGGAADTGRGYGTAEPDGAADTSRVDSEGDTPDVSWVDDVCYTTLFIVVTAKSDAMKSVSSKTRLQGQIPVHWKPFCAVLIVADRA